VPKKPLLLAALLLAGTLTLTACGSDNDNDDSDGHMPGMGSSSPMMSPTDGMALQFNAADVTFATDMISHHRQAIEMAELATTRAKNQQVKDLAAQIEQAQDPEIQTMADWLTAWGKPVPDDMSGMDMSGSMPGMMSTEDMQMLQGMSGAGFDRMFLQMMIEHHQGAIEMARTEQADGTNADAQALAEQIENAQTAEITTVRSMLK
jgi:uncharacterized protein (DUF305 family)